MSQGQTPSTVEVDVVEGTRKIMWSVKFAMKKSVVNAVERAQMGNAV